MFIFKWAGLRVENKYPTTLDLSPVTCEFIFFLATPGRGLKIVHLAFECSRDVGFSLPGVWLQLFHIHSDPVAFWPASSGKFLAKPGVPGAWFLL